jgi:hypothetical protein
VSAGCRRKQRVLVGGDQRLAVQPQDGEQFLSFRRRKELNRGPTTRGLAQCLQPLVTGGAGRSDAGEPSTHTRSFRPTLRTVGGDAIGVVHDLRLVAELHRSIDAALADRAGIWVVDRGPSDSGTYTLRG